MAAGEFGESGVYLTYLSAWEGPWETMGQPTESTEVLASANASWVRSWIERSDISSCIQPNDEKTKMSRRGEFRTKMNTTVEWLCVLRLNL